MKFYQVLILAATFALGGYLAASAQEPSSGKWILSASTAGSIPSAFLWDTVAGELRWCSANRCQKVDLGS